jgi:hypothetical protein
VQAREYAEQEFGLSEIQSDGRTLREHLEAVERLTKKRPQQLDNQVELPKSMRECWQWFLSLNNTRPSGFGASPITYQEIWCYFNLQGIEPEQWEIDIIKMFDNIAMSFARKQQQEKEDKQKKK